MLFPKNILLHLFSSRLSVAPIGDLIFGILIFIILGEDIITFFLWSLLAITGAIIITLFNIFVGSLTFWFGNAENFSGILSEAMITFSLYPNNVYKGVVKIVLLTIIPATYLGQIPLKILGGHGKFEFLILLIFVLLLSFLSVKFFYWGLKKYESGNLLNINS